MKKIIGIVFIALLSALIAVWLYATFFKSEPEYVEITSKPTLQLADFSGSTSSDQPIDLSTAANKAVPAVVHVQTLYHREQQPTNLFDYFFGFDNRYQNQEIVRGYGSGVIISEDGYIITNNHVIKESDNIQVVLHDKRFFKAELIGQDATTDLALLKINADRLSTIAYGNSDKVKLGEWVLAVGNPYNLTSTVTAGIISAKARSIGLKHSQMSIESFIQTDAAVNPGNSGGALVNVNGDLIGINTAIQSKTGAYSGYSFAIPVNMVKKVVKDIKEFGQVQRAFIGAVIQEINAVFAKEKGINDIEGVYVNEIIQNGAAENSGIQIGDIILSLNNIKVNSLEQFLEQISKYRPGDKVDILIKRGGKLKHFHVELRNRQGSTALGIQKQINILGAEFSPVSRRMKWELQIDNGVQITKLRNGLFKKTGIKKGFIITRINNTEIHNEWDIESALNDNMKGDTMYIYGIYLNGRRAYYTLKI